MSSKKKQSHVNKALHTLSVARPTTWAQCMAAIHAEFPDPAGICKYLQSDSKRVPKTTGVKSTELVRARLARELALPPHQLAQHANLWHFGACRLQIRQALSGLKVLLRKLRLVPEAVRGTDAQRSADALPCSGSC